MASADTDYPTTIGADAFFKGHLEFEKGARLLGRFEGEISSKGELLVAQGAKINAEVQVDTIRIDGEVRGNLHATSKIQLSSSGRVEGDIQAMRLEVAEGAILIGRCTIGSNGTDQAKASAKPNPPGPVASNKVKGGPPTTETGKK